MKNILTRGVPVLAVVILVALGYVAMSAQSGGDHPTTSNASGRALDAPLSAVLTGRTLVKSAISYDNPAFGVGLVAGPQGLDGVTTINCPGTTTCTIGAEMNVQLGYGNNSPGVSLCLSVDGSVVSCPTLGTIPASGWSFISFALATSVPHGTHTVQTLVWPSDVASRGFYTISYRVYKP